MCVCHVIILKLNLLFIIIIIIIIIIINQLLYFHYVYCSVIIVRCVVFRTQTLRISLQSGQVAGTKSNRSMFSASWTSWTSSWSGGSSGSAQGHI